MTHKKVKLMACSFEVPYFATSVDKFSKHFGLSFAYDSPKIWNDLPDGVRSTTSLNSFRKKLKIYLFAQAYPPKFLRFRFFPWR